MSDKIDDETLAALAAYKGPIERLPRGKMTTDMALASWRKKAAIRKRRLKLDDAPKVNATI
jgi:hypothetical protein